MYRLVLILAYIFVCAICPIVIFLPSSHILRRSPFFFYFKLEISMIFFGRHAGALWTCKVKMTRIMHSNGDTNE